MSMRRSLVTLCAAFALIFPQALLAGDVLLVHGHIYTGNAKAPWAQALAISGTRIDAVGTDQEVLARKHAGTQVIDLEGRTVVPGFSDSHTHMWFGGLELHGLNLSTPDGSITPEDEPEELVKRLKAFAAERPNGKVLDCSCRFQHDSAIHSHSRIARSSSFRSSRDRSQHGGTRALGKCEGAGVGRNHGSTRGGSRGREKHYP